MSGDGGAANMDYDVIVVGGGPVGMTAALLLDKLGLRTALIEKRSGPIGHPAGHVLNPRAMEIWRSIDPTLEAEIRNDSAAPEDVRYVVWCMSLADAELGRLNLVAEDPDKLARQLAYSPSRHAHYPQSRLEAALWRRVAKTRNVSVFASTTASALESGNDGVSLQITGPGGSRSLRARYCLAADGARSAIREQLGIGMPGPTIARIASVHFKANLDRYTKHRPAIMYWIYNREFLGPLIRHMDDEWILMTLLHPPQRPEHFDEAHWRELIGHALGTKTADVSINVIGNWSMTAQIADRFRAGRVFMVGDAAHRFPPTGGYGINTGVQDVHNLVWKLKAVIDGQADDTLLESYEAERKPVAEVNCKQSLDNQMEMEQVNALVSVRMNDMLKLHHLMESRLVRLLPERWRLRMVRVLTRLGMSRVAALKRGGAAGRRLRSRVRAAIAQQLAHFGAHGVELGYRYSGALTVDAPYSPNELSTSELHYQPSTVPGVMLPHCWVDHDGRRVSTLDLIDYRAMLLIVDPAWQQEWREAAAHAADDFGYPLRILTIGVDEDVQARDVDGSWARLRTVDASGAILVRPDGHVAWRTRAMPVDPKLSLHKVLSQLRQGFGAAAVPFDSVEECT